MKILNKINHFNLKISSKFLLNFRQKQSNKNVEKQKSAEINTPSTYDSGILENSTHLSPFNVVKGDERTKKQKKNEFAFFGWCCGIFRKRNDDDRELLD